MRESRKKEIKSILEQQNESDTQPVLVHIGYSLVKTAQNVCFWFAIGGKLVLMKIHKQSIRKGLSNFYSIFFCIKQFDHTKKG